MQDVADAEEIDLTVSDDTQTGADAIDEDNECKYNDAADDPTDANDNARSAFDMQSNSDAKDRMRAAAATDANRTATLASKRASRRSERAVLQQQAEQEAKEEAEEIEMAEKEKQALKIASQLTREPADDSSSDSDNDDDEKNYRSNKFIDDAAEEDNEAEEEEDDAEPAEDDDESDDSERSLEPQSSARGRNTKAATKAASSTSDSSDSSSDSETEQPVATPMSPPTSPIKTAAAAISPASSPIKSPVKAWKPAVSASGGYSSNGGSKSASYLVKVLMITDTGVANNKGGMVARVSVIAQNLAKDQPILIVAYATDATNYLGKLKVKTCYSMQLDALQLPANKPNGLGQETTFKLATGGKITEYTPKSKNELKAAEATVDSMLKPISHIASVPEGTLVGFSGIVIERLPSITTGRLLNAVKVIIADDTHYVNVMFFDHKNLNQGDTVIIKGGIVWKNPRLLTTEVSIMSSSSLVCSGAMAEATVVLSEKTRKNCRHQSHKKPNKMINVSGVPTKEVRHLVDIKAEAASLSDVTGVVQATVMLRFDDLPSKSPLTFNGCLRCRKKVKPLDRKDAKGNPVTVYGHFVDEEHEATSYGSYYFFVGRLREPNDDTSIYTAQIDDVIGNKMFGVTAEQLADLEPKDLTDLLSTACKRVWKMNVTVAQSGDITSLVIV